MLRGVGLSRVTVTRDARDYEEVMMMMMMMMMMMRRRRRRRRIVIKLTYHR
jgi:hypothetical protein